MAQSMHIPDFGDWQGAENAPYSAYFENARKGKDRDVTNPNRPQQKPALRKDVSDSHKVVSNFTRRHHNETEKVVPYKKHTAQQFPVNRHAGRGRTSEVKPKRVEDYPTQNRYGCKGIAGKGGGVSSPSRERKSSDDGSSHARSRKSRLRSVTQDDERSDGPVPQFGEWDENNPSSAEMYSQIFEKVREEKLSGGGKVPPPLNPETTDSGIGKEDNYVISKSCYCFPWNRK